MIEYNLADIFEAVADAIPDRPGVVAGDTRLTYAELDERCTRLAHALAERGIGKDDHVGVYMQNGNEYLETMLAAFKLRAVPINVNYRYVEDELRYLFLDADLKAVVASREFAPYIAAIRSECPLLATVVFVDDDSDADTDAVGDGVFDFEKFLSAGSPTRDFGERSGDDFFCIYTGGTTGMPKGVMWRHADIFMAGLAGGNPAGPPVESLEQLVETAKGRYSLGMFPAAPLMHGAAQLATFIGLNWGDKIILQRKFSANGIVDLIEAEKINTMSIVGDAMAKPIADAFEAAQAAGRDISSLFVVSSAGAIFSTPVKERIKKVLPNCLLLDNYGSTETGFQGTGTESERSSFGAGLAFQMNDRTTVLDDDLVPVVPGSGVVGHVALRRWVPTAYYGDPEKSAKTFVTIDGVRHSITGDIATIEADGTIKLFGRGSQCINSGGEKIFVEEVENALTTHPAVKDAVVVGVPDERFGEHVAALVSLEDGAVAPSVDELIAHARTHVAGYKAPREIFFLDEIFRGPNGKADYKMSKRIAAERSAEAASAAS